MAKEQHDGPFNVCIYCGGGGPLSDEHIIPHALNGVEYLKNASCAACATITSQFEMAVLRGMVYDVRVAHGYKSRKGLPTEIALLKTTNGEERSALVDPSKHPVVLTLPIFDKVPGFIEKREPTPGIGVKGLQIMRFGRDPAELVQEHGADKIGILQKIDRVAFARMIAKIAYCTIVYNYGLDCLREIYVLDVIRGLKDDLGTWVFSSEDATPEDTTGALHAIHYATHSDPENPSDNGVLVYIKLFANTPSIAYGVLVGRRGDREFAG